MSIELERFVGTWRTDPRDRWSSREYGDVSLTFLPDGRLVYTVYTPDKDQIIHLTFRIERHWLVTNQPSSPREERTEFYFTEDGRLAVKNGGTQPDTFYVRVAEAVG